MNITFREAIIISVMAHAIGIGSFYRSPAPYDHKKEKRDMVIDYVVIKEPKADIRETPRIEIPKKIDVKPPVKTAEERKSEKPEESKEPTDDIAARQARFKETKDYINYYQLIREKIRRRLKVNYADRSREGEVLLNFTLGSDGVVLACAADRSASVNDDTLIQIAERSLKESSPFPPLPREPGLPQMSFSVTVSFKKR